MVDTDKALVERLLALAEKQKDARGDMMYRGEPDPEIVDAAARIEAMAKRITELEKERFNTGYLIAISTMLHQHGCTVTAEDAIRDSGITLKDANSIGLDDFDMNVLRPIFANIKRCGDYDKKKRRALAGKDAEV